MRRNSDPPSTGLDVLDDPRIVRDTTIKLLAYCRANAWAGYDPYDALNSRVFRALPFLNFRVARLVLTQGVKRCPVNLRPPLAVPKTPNAKGIALFLSSLVTLREIGLVEEDGTIGALADKLLTLRSPGIPASGWGYNFDWQTRGELVPRGSPNIICTTFAANALLDAYERTPKKPWLEASLSAAEYIWKAFFWRDREANACFSYTPSGPDKVHNANLLGAAFLCRIFRVSGERKFLDSALEAARYSAGRQRENGAWDYGELPHQRWIDNFHTGFNLGALRRIGEFGGTREFDAAIRCGFTFYRDHFFREDGAPRYFHNATYPIDIHSVAQSILTLVEFKDLSKGNLNLAHSVLKWGMAHMWDARGYFYFQKRPSFTTRIPFMRWSEAWMLLALAALMNAGKDKNHD